VLTGQQTTYSTVTNESGNFTEPDLPSGTYTVTVAAPGFKKETRENIAVITNTTARVDVTWPPAAPRRPSPSLPRPRYCRRTEPIFRPTWSNVRSPTFR
jgi:Carboxypeptidase regulatory-like domain